MIFIILSILSFISCEGEKSKSLSYEPSGTTWDHVYKNGELIYWKKLSGDGKQILQCEKKRSWIICVPID